MDILTHKMDKMEEVKAKLKAYIMEDDDFQKIEIKNNLTLEEAVDEVLERFDCFILDKKYIDISWVVIDDIIFNVDNIYATVSDVLQCECE